MKIINIKHIFPLFFLLIIVKIGYSSSINYFLCFFKKKNKKEESFLKETNKNEKDSAKNLKTSTVKPLSFTTSKTIYKFSYIINFT